MCLERAGSSRRRREVTYAGTVCQASYQVQPATLGEDESRPTDEQRASK